MNLRIGKILIVLLSVLVLALVYRKEESLVGNISYEEENSEYFEMFYMYEKKLRLTKVIKLEADPIREIFTYLTANASYAPLQYYSVLSNSASLVSYEIDDKQLYLKVDRQFLFYNKNDEYAVCALIMENYELLGYEEVYLSISNINQEKLNNIINTKEYKSLITINGN